MPRSRKPKRRAKAGRPQKYTDKDIIAAVTAKKGGVFLAAAALGCNPDTIYERAKVSKAVAECLEMQTGIIDDMAEMVIYRNLLSDDPYVSERAAEYRLNTRGKHRGYSTKTEVEHTEGVKLMIVEEIVDSTDGIPPV